MKKFSTHTIRGFATGVAVSALVATLISPAAATTIQQIRVAMGGIKIYVDGNLQIPRDVNGNQVEPLIYDGTTYLPVRALTGMLTNKTVDWDASAQAVYIGAKPDVDSVQLDTLEAYKTNNAYMRTGDNAIFKSLGTEYKPSNCIRLSEYGGYIIYKLDSNYSKLKGTYLIQHDDLDCNGIYQFTVLSVDTYGTETELYSREVKAGDPPLPVEVNVSGCNYVKIKQKHVSGHSHYGAFYDVSLAP